MNYQIPFFQHDLGEEELESLRRVLQGPILTTGKTVSDFEALFADYMGNRYCVAVTSCTGALHLSLTALGIGPGHEVITTPMTFIASSTAILQAGAKPVFVDVEENTGNIDLSRIPAAITDRTRAILPVHLYGQMVDMTTLHGISKKYNLHVIEDAAHCIEGVREGVKPGQLSDTACFSFYASKNITCGEGGAIVTNDKSLAERLKLLRHHGMNKTAADRHVEGYRHWDMIQFGWKYNLDNLHAALLIPQLKRIESNWRKRQAIADRYRELLEGVAGVRVIGIPSPLTHANHLFPIRVDGSIRDKVVQKLINQGVGVVVNYRAIHLLSYFSEQFGFKAGDFPIAEKFGNEVISLPMYPNLPLSSVERVVEAVRTAVAV